MSKSDDSISRFFQPFILTLILVTSCQTTNISESNMSHYSSSEQKYTNALIHESSPYLLQHAHNPVNWYPWGEEALELAKKEDKPILVSIGYAACHWCHVMERESFENEQLAQLMNENFICIKVDREERPDIDNIYMNALQLMGQHGGWPLNVFITPDQKPFYGGTYFHPNQWESVLIQIDKTYTEKRERIEEYANKLTNGLNDNQSFNISVDSNQTITKSELDQAFKAIERRFDKQNGGMGNAPKFPMPSIYEYLLSYQHYEAESAKSQEILQTTLSKMATGGIYDQIGGGFCRYATDEKWLIPHFEKMLYDNGQLLSLYSHAYKNNPNDLYKTTIEETIAFCERELMGKHGNFFSSLDADSEGEEGKFYVWSYEELNNLLGADFDEFKHYYNVSEHGNWEGKIIFERNPKYLDQKFDAKKIKTWKDLILKERSNRIRPGLDDKTLTSWNALMLSGLCDSYQALGNEQFKELAITNGNFIASKIMTSEGKLFRNFKNNRVTIDGFLEDYALVIDAFLDLYEITFDYQWIEKANLINNYCTKNFLDTQDQFYYFTDLNSKKLINRRKEVQDNVIPSPNSVMARNLFRLGTLLENQNYIDQAKTMGLKMKDVTLRQSSFMANWCQLLIELHESPFEIVITGSEDQQHDLRKELQRSNTRNSIYMTPNTQLPLTQGKSSLDGKATVYVCQNKTCKIPVHSVEEALNLINDLR